MSAALNDMVRARRLAGGELGEEVRFGDKAFYVGDRVLFERNQRVPLAGVGAQGDEAPMIRIRNGTFGTVVGAVGPSDTSPTREGDVRGPQGDAATELNGGVPWRTARSLVVELAGGERAVLPRSYVEASTSLGYALTVFRSQGITVDHTFGLGGDSLYQEAGYTQLSRGRLSNRLYVASPENPRWEIGHLEDDVTRRDALQSLKEALSQSREQTMAQDRLPVWPVLQPDAMAATYRQHAELEQWLAEHAPTDLTDQLADLCDRVSRLPGMAGDGPAGPAERASLGGTSARAQPVARGSPRGDQYLVRVGGGDPAI